jgi:hypothetical protein
MGMRHAGRSRIIRRRVIVVLLVFVCFLHSY